NVAWIRGPASIEPDLAAAVARDAPASTELLSRHDWYEQLRAAPLIQVIADGFRLAFILAAVYAAISIITALTLTAARRGQDLARQARAVDRSPPGGRGMSMPATATEPLIECDGLVKIFKVADLEVVALQGLDLIVDRGEFVAIVGASGSGKSTLLSILGGLDVPSAGRVVVDGHLVAEMDAAERTGYRRRVLGFV